MKKLLYSLLTLTVILASCDDTTEGVGYTLTAINDRLTVTADSFDVSTSTKPLDSVVIRSASGYLGKIKDQETGAYITGNFAMQFHSFDDFHFPAIDSITSLDAAGNIIADSCIISLYSDKWTGDSTTTMKLRLCEMAKPLSENETYYTTFDPRKEGYLRSDDGCVDIKQPYSIIDNTISDSLRWSSDYRTIRIKLDAPYTPHADRSLNNGVSTNNYGTYLMRSYYEHPEYYKNASTFIKNVCPGFYAETVGGSGCIATIGISQMMVYFHYYEKGKATSGYTIFSGTEEVLQKTNISQDNTQLLESSEADVYTYLKTPAGLCTEVTLPIEDIFKGHENDTLSTARIFLNRVNNTISNDYSFSIPSTLLILPEDNVYSFFRNKEVADYKESFITSYTSSTNGYTFGNISSMIRKMWEKRKNAIQSSGMTEEEYDRQHPNWNKALIIPIQTAYTTVSSSNVLTKVTHDLTIGSTRLVRGTEKNSPIKISCIYSKFQGE